MVDGSIRPKGVTDHKPGVQAGIHPYRTLTIHAVSLTRHSSSTIVQCLSPIPSALLLLQQPADDGPTQNASPDTEALVAPWMVDVKILFLPT
jgi:hypothetical protein